MIKLKILLAVSALLVFNTVKAGTPVQQLKLWYNRPVEKWDAEALPIGNGRMGAMLFGGIKTEHAKYNLDD